MNTNLAPPSLEISHISDGLEYLPNFKVQKVLALSSVVAYSRFVLVLMSHICISADAPDLHNANMYMNQQRVIFT